MLYHKQEKAGSKRRKAQSVPGLCLKKEKWKAAWAAFGLASAC